MKNYERVVAEVDLDAVIHNLRAMQEHVGEDVMMCAGGESGRIRPWRGSCR